MDFQERYRKHKTAIQKRWVPILKEVLLEEELGKQISILKKAKQQAGIFLKMEPDFTSGLNQAVGCRK